MIPRAVLILWLPVDPIAFIILRIKSKINKYEHNVKGVFFLKLQRCIRVESKANNQLFSLMSQYSIIRASS